MTPMLTQISRRARALAAIAALVPALSACEDFLRAENPGAIPEPDLTDLTYIPLMVQGTVGEFQRMFPQVIYYTGLFSDELRNHHVFFEERDIDRRLALPEHGTISFFAYQPLHRARHMADTAAARMKTLLGDSAVVDTRLARVLAYGGYTHILLAELMCESPVNGSAPYTPAQLLTEFAIPKFEEAIEIATRVRGDLTRTAAVRASADSILNFARVGAARAHLNLNDKTAALQYANDVLAALPAAADTLWTFRAWYSENSAGENMYIFTRLTGTSGVLSGSLTGTPFVTMTDRRVPRPVVAERTQNALEGFVPNSPRAYSSYTGDAAATDSARRVGADFIRAGWIRIASWREARYIKAEAEGNTPANLAFLNAQKKLGEDTTTVAPASETEYLALVRDQRRREFYLDGHRLGDLRRYKEFHGVDEFQRGPYLGGPDTYGPQECWVLPLTEINGNPNVPRP
jgi:hypothetical protein